MVAPLPMTPSVIDKPIVLTMLLNPDPLNATVIVPNGQVYYQITTNQSLAGYTEVKDGQQNRIGLIEWASHPPHVQVRTVLSRRRVGSWLVLSRDGTYVHFFLRAFLPVLNILYFKCSRDGACRTNFSMGT
jgi:hypothetical protein